MHPLMKILNIDNMDFDAYGLEANVIYCDPVYEDENFNIWIDKFWELLRPNSIFIVQTDWHTCPDIWAYLKKKKDSVFVSHSVWKCEWGNHPRRTFHQCFDDILIFSNGKDYKFYPEKIQVDKVTKNKGLNPSGRTTKQATAWIDDICLTTTSLERVKKDDGHLVRWQKPIRLFDRIVAPFVDDGDLVIDPFAGSGSLGEWCVANNMNYIGMENDMEVFELAKARIEHPMLYLKV
jgi:DNA modification methylase